MCVFHSPYSTVSASRAHVIVLSNPMEAPIMNNPTIANGVFVLARKTIRAPINVPTHPSMNPRFLPRIFVTQGPNGPTYSTAPVVMIVTRLSSEAVPPR